jgi:hypothetical protein
MHDSFENNFDLSATKVKSQKKKKDIFTIMLQMIRLWSIFIVMFIQPMLRWRQS